ncbi:hypothetical protein [Natronorubrum sulfidifaciens]|uniref:Glycerophosphoryl diester phosphodiesterase membrane domain-containing protein n=1 Tax=Natronorubrum sulfidifaciens JCM 14089 TaxID=1230460 RepID=L9W2V8_9EURY|nr:hypothetical protein [Natronorubrum sulfidifaciens]ELY43829.1 hypothetical protein C495_12230 [Natronorubrum sulfidifaciens JCM 14089]
MTDEPFGPQASGDREQESEPGGALARAVARIRADPFLLVPFALAGLLLSLLDQLRLWDPIPTLVTERLPALAIDFEFSIFPTGTPGTTRRVAALVDLETPYLLWAVSLEVAAVLAVSIAGWYTIARAADADATTTGLRSYVGFVVLIAIGGRLLGSIAEVTLSGIVGLALFLLLFVLALVVLARLFVAPAIAALGSSPWVAIRRSVRLSSGHEYGLVGLVLFYGLLGWLLGSVPAIGAVVSSVGVAVVHAVSTVTVLESVSDNDLLE